MHNTFRNDYVQLIERTYDPDRLSEHLIFDNPRHQLVARPLFRNGILAAAMAARIGYHAERKPPYPHDDHILTIHLQGKLNVILGEQTHAMKPGDIAYCPPGTPFRRFGEKDDLSYWIYFRIADTEFWTPLKQQGPYVTEYKYTDLVFLLLRRLLDADPLMEPDSIRYILGDAMTLNRLLSRLRHAAPVAASPHSVALRQLLSDIEQSPSKKWTAQEMAKQLCVSSRTLERIFQQELHRPPQDIVITIRMKYATHLLTRTTHKLSRVAESVGYESVYSFSRLFRKHIGMSPGQYRQMTMEQFHAQNRE